MKKLLAVLLALCLLASMPLMALATTDSAVPPMEENKPADQPAIEATEAAVPEAEAPVAPAATTDSSQRLTFSFDASFSATDMSEDELAAAQGVVEFVKSLTFEVAYADAGDLILMDIWLRAGDTLIGELDIAFNAETVYISGDMLPEGWITLDMAEMTEMFSAQVSELQGMSADQEAAMQTVMTLVEQLFIAVQGWMEEHPEVMEQMPLENLPAGMDPVVAWMRLNITKDMYPAIYRSMDASLRTLAAQGELNDIDGKPITADGYDQSAIGQMMAQVLSGMDDIEMEGVVDVLADAQGGVPGISVDLTIEDVNMFMTLLRNTAADGAVAWNGEFEIKDDPVTADVTGTITAASNAPDAETRRVEAALTGKITSTSGTDDGSFGLSGYAEYPGETTLSPAQLFSTGLQGDITVSNDEKLDFAFEAHANQGTGGDVDFKTTFGFDFLDGSDKVSFASGLGIAYQASAEGLPIPDLTGAKLYPMTEMSDAEMEAYTTQAQGTLMSFLFKLMAAMPPSLQSQMR